MIHAGARNWRRLPHKMKPQTAQTRALADHERDDVNIRGLAIFVVALAVVAIVIHVAIWAMLKALQRNAGYPEPFARPPARTVSQAPYPVLQVAPARDMEEFRAREETALHSYGWVDRTS